MSPIAIKSAVPTLRPGDVITNLACRSCADNQILVLERNQTDTSFELSVRSSSLNIVRDPKGPFRWTASANTFVDKKGKHFEHINLDTVVVPGAGLKQLSWYQELPAKTDVPYLINMETLTESVGPAEQAKIQALVHSMEVTGGRLSLVANNMQQALGVALGNTDVSEQQMRALLLVINAYLSDTVLRLEQQAPSPSMADMFAMFNVMDGVFGSGMRMDFQGRRPAPRSHEQGHSHVG